MGKQYPRPLTGDELLASPAFTGYVIEGVPLYVTVAGEYVKVPGMIGTQRKDNGTVLGIVSNKYRILQVSEALQHVDALMPDGIMRYETGGWLWQGQTWWALAKMPGKQEIALAANNVVDSMESYLLTIGGFDGKIEHQMFPTTVRVVCQNTQNMAMAAKGKQWVGMRHRGNLDAKIMERRNLLAEYNTLFTGFADEERKLAEVKWTATPASRTALADLIKEFYPEVDKDGAAKTRRNNAVADIKWRMCEENERNGGPLFGTWYGVEQAMTEYIDHGITHYKGSKSDPIEAASNRMSSLLWGGNAGIKAQIHKRIMEVAGVA